MKNNYEEYIEMLNKYYLNNRKYSEIDTSQSRFFNHFRASNNEEKYIIDDNIKSVYGHLDYNMEERNLDQYGYLENKSYPNIEAPYNEKYLEESDKKYKEENGNQLIEEKDERFIEEIYNDTIIERNNENFIVERDNDFIEVNNEDFIEENGDCLVQEKDNEFLSERDEEFLDENYNISINEELSKDNISIEELYVKFPVILAETSITISVEDTITLNEEVKEIIRIKKNVFLTQSRLVPFSSSDVEPNSGILFIKGFIRNNIEYKTQTDTVFETVNTCGDKRHCIFEVPFNFTTRIAFIRPPIFIENTTASKLGFLTDEFQKFDSCIDLVIEGDGCEQCFKFTEVFNDKPFVELVKATFIEVDINKDIDLSQDGTKEQGFTKIKGKTILNLILRVLQKQQLRLEVE